jgi:hypothetical protein
MVRAMLSESLRAVISQTLLKTKDGGRVAAHEIMIGTPAIRNLIREGKIAQMYSSIQTGAALRHADARPVPADLVSKRNIVSQGRSALQGREQRISRSSFNSSAAARPPWIANKPSNSCTTCCARWWSEGLRPVHHRRLPAGDQGRRQDDAVSPQR